jgi:DNA-directed RNA polymerase subunit beta'
LETLFDFFLKPVNPRLYKGVQIGLASPEQIRSWSHGEIKKPETINYRTFKPERDGLFCAKIFGPIKDYECNCGKYKRMKHRGVICEKCGVEVIQSKVRRERMAHIDLATPVSHIWFLKSLPSKIGNILDLTLKSLEKVIYFDNYIVIDPKETGLAAMQLLSEDKYREAIELYGPKFEAAMGADAIRELLRRVDIEKLYHELRQEIHDTGSDAKRKKLSKRMKVVDAFRRSGLDPAWMVLETIPVLPPELRPLVPLEGGRFATSDLNDLYRRVINRNNRLKRLMDLKAPDIIVRNEKRMLQEAVDVLIDNGRQGRVVTGTNKRPLKSLSETLKGKQGRFRQNLLGKRVDYSGRSVITIGPNLRLHQCGLPKLMALELFKPFIYNRLEKKNLVSNVKSAKKLVESKIPEVWDTLDEVVKEYPVMLNRAPTLHRLGIQAFEPVLIEGKAIQLHPLVCTAFNADFDGDQMAVHIPLSLEAQIEARVLMLASNNILSPANGDPIIIPTQDIVLGIYYMTLGLPGSKGDGMVFSDTDEVRAAFDGGAVDLHAKIKVRIDGRRHDTTVGRVLLWEIIPKGASYILRHIMVSSEDAAKAVIGELQGGAQFKELVDTFSEAFDKTYSGNIGLLEKEEFQDIFQVQDRIADALYSLDEGQVSDIIFSGGKYHLFHVLEIRREIPFDSINMVLNKKGLRDLVNFIYRHKGPKATVILSDQLKDIGYRYSTMGGLSISIDAMIIPETKSSIVGKAEHDVAEITKQWNEGLITQGEKYNKVVDIWAKATDDIANEMMVAMEKPFTLGRETLPGDADNRLMERVDSKGEAINPIFMMADSGARGSKEQMRQLAGMRGLMAKPSGEIIETPITANFREGLSVLQYFISTHGARKGLADTALKTANSGYLTRRLADVAQDCTVMEMDCGVKIGIEIEALMEGGEVIQPLAERVLGRTALTDVLDPFTEEVLIRAGDEIDEAGVVKIDQAGVSLVKIRSVLTCKTRSGVCSKCYGRDLSHGGPVEIGQSVGIMAAQSIGEPGTQLTMRTFHIGGTANRRVEVAEIRARMEGTVKYGGMTVAVNSENRMIVMNRRGGEFAIMSDSGRELERFPVIYGAEVMIQDGQKVKPGDILAVWDPFTTPIITAVSGRVKFGDLVIGKTLKEKVDAVTGKSSLTVVDSKMMDGRPRISIKDEDGKTAIIPGSGSARYSLPVETIVMVEENDYVAAGDIIGKLPRETTKTKDITGGLPRVAELFEVRKPKETAILSEIDGFVSIAKAPKKGKQKVTVAPVDAGEKKEYLIPRGRHIIVLEGDFVKAGEQLTGGSPNPQDILTIRGDVALARYLLNGVQEVYRLQGVKINDKHIEIIIRQMMRRIKIKTIGDTTFIPEEQVDRNKFEEANRLAVEQGGQPATGEPLILGITKASLSTESFISAASFQETTKVLTEACIAGAYDPLNGLKENVIMGRLIPAGTGMDEYSRHEIDLAGDV